MHVIVWHAEDEGATGATGPFETEAETKAYVEKAWAEFSTWDGDDSPPEEGEWTHRNTWQGKDGMWDFATVLQMDVPRDFS